MADAVEAARARIDRALNDLEARVRALKARPAPPPDEDLFAPRAGEGEHDAARLAALEAAAAEASQLLGHAAAEVRALMNGKV